MHTGLNGKLLFQAENSLKSEWKYASDQEMSTSTPDNDLEHLD